MKRSFLSMLLLFLFAALSAGDLEEFFESQAEDQDSELFLQAQYYADNPLDLNTASYDDMIVLPFISSAMVKAILSYRAKHGRFNSVDEIEKVNRVRPLADLLVNFFTVHQSVINDLGLKLRSRVTYPGQESKAYKDNKYKGNAHKLYNRINIQQGKYSSAGAVAEKDPGESMTADYHTEFLECFVPDYSLKIVLGSYQIKSGQGMVFWGPYKMYMGFNPIVPAIKSGHGLKSSLSVDENFNFYGAGISLPLGKFKITGFYSDRKIDAKVENDIITGFYSTGYHRFGNEIKSKDAVTVKNMGAIAEWQHGEQIQIGVNTLLQKYSYPFIKEDVYLKQHQVISTYYNYFFKSVNVFSELARSGANATGFVTGGIYSGPGFQAVLLYRNYDDAFHSPNGRAFGDNFTPNNEKGRYWGWSWKPLKNTLFSFYNDQYKHPVFEETTGSELMGQEWMIGAEQRINNTLVHVRFRAAEKRVMEKVFDTWGNNIRIQNVYSKHLLRIQVQHKAGRWQTKTRFEFAGINWQSLKAFNVFSDSTSVLMFQDICYKYSNRFDIKTRWSLFDAPLYDLRFYQFENDLAGVMKMQMLMDRGSRWYVVAGLNLFKQIRVSFKYEITRYDNLDEVGSGDNLVTDDKLSKFSFQLDFRK